VKILSLDPVEIGDWVFKVSMNDDDGGIIVIGLHRLFQYTVIKSFIDVDDAYDWVEILIDSSAVIKGEDIK